MWTVLKNALGELEMLKHLSQGTNFEWFLFKNDKLFIPNLYHSTAEFLTVIGWKVSIHYL